MAAEGGLRDAFEQSRLALFASHGFDGRAVELRDASGRRIAAVEGGVGDRTTVLVHAALSDAGEWALIAGRLDGRVVVPDWPGAGLSDPISARHAGLRRFGEQWLSSVVDALGVEQVDLVGSSAGGYLATVFALAHPERVHRLVQVGSPPGLVKTIPLLFRLFATPVLGRVLLGQQPKDAEANRSAVFSRLVEHAERVPVEMLEHDLRAMALPGVTDGGVDFARALARPLRGIRTELVLDGEIRSLAVPTLYLWGTKDNFVRPERVRDLLSEVTAIRLQLVEDAGHLLTYEQPVTVADAIRDFTA